MATTDGFVHLHVHSEFSLLDGACKIEALIGAAERCGMKSLAITDHGNMFGAVQFYQKAMARGIRPIIGYEAYVAPGSRHERDAKGISDAAFHLTLLCRDQTGYRNLVQLATKAYLEGFYYRPRIDKELLAQHADGLIALSGCLKSEACHLITSNDEAEALAVLGGYRDIFGKDNFHVELQNNGMPEQARCAEALARMANELGLKAVATNDIHYLTAADAEAHGVLLCIRTGKTIDDATRMQMTTQEYYFKSAAEMAARFADYPEALAHTAEVASRCNLEMSFRERHFPDFRPDEPGIDNPTYLRRLCYEGVKTIYGDRPAKEVTDRLDYELKVIEHMGYVSYFLIVWDFVKFARGHKIPSGMRGSGVGSMVSYTLGLTDIDPIQYDLLFQRFLDPERREPPDIDIDLCEVGRADVIDYVKKRYGAENTAQIITFGTMKARAVVRDVGRVLNMPFNQVDALAKMVPTTLGIKLSQALDQNPDLKREYQANSDVKRLIDISMRLEGLSRHASIHAAGVVIADRPLVNYLPLCKAGADETLATQYPMNDLEAIGMLKMDFLGLRTLTMVGKCIDLIEAQTGTRLDLAHVPLDDKPTYTLLQEGRGKGVFQMSSSGMCGLLRDLKPDVLEDIIAVVALYRPGPLQSGAVAGFIERKHDPSKIRYLHPMLETIARQTYGVIMYQEQIMRVVHEMGSLSMAKALTLIKAISKKKKSVVDTLKVEFIEGATKKGIKPEVAEQVYATIEPFAGYGFNKAHTTAYAFLAYRTAYLKAHYPREFMAALMTSEMANTDKIAECREECADLGIELLPPDVNRSRGEFAVDGDAIRYGLAAVKNVGGRSVDAILHERDANGQFTSLFDLCRRIDLHNVNKSVIESLIKAGAMDGFTVPRARLAAGIDRALDAGNQAQADRQKKQMSLFDALSPKDDFRADFEQLPDVPEWPENVLLTNEKDVIGFYLSKHPLASHRQMLQRFSTAKLAGLRSLADGTKVVIGGLVVNPIVRVIQTGPNEGQQMGKFTLDDASGSCEAVLFSDQFKRHGHLMKADSIVFAVGTVSLRNAAPSLRVSEIVSIGAARAELTDHVTITIAPGHQHADILPRLREVIDHHQGVCPVYFRVASDGSATLVRAGAHWRVAPSESFEYAICGLLGEGSLEYTPHIAPPRPEAVRATSASAPPPPMAAFAEDLDITVEEEESAF